MHAAMMGCLGSMPTWGQVIATPFGVPMGRGTGRTREPRQSSFAKLALRHGAANLSKVAVKRH